jgi:hypothetical protein
LTLFASLASSCAWRLNSAENYKGCYILIVLEYSNSEKKTIYIIKQKLVKNIWQLCTSFSDASAMLVTITIHSYMAIARDFQNPDQEFKWQVFRPWGRLFKGGLALIQVWNLTHCFSLHIYLCMSIYFKMSEKKTPDKICEEILPNL